MDHREQQKGRYAAIILAAGYSSRMGAFKPLLPLGGTPAAKMLILTAREAGLNPVVVVTGHEHVKLENALVRITAQDPAVHMIYNESYASGMFSSIRKGLGHLRKETDGDMPDAGKTLTGCFVLPVDCPLTGTQTLSAMLAGIEKTGAWDDFAVPTYEGKKGHPLYVPAVHWDRILADDGAGGLRAVTYHYQQTMLRVPVSREGAVMDMDTWEDYESLQDYLVNGSGPSLAALAEGRRFFLVRHGQIEQHEEPIFLGQTDVPLSEEGKRQAAAAAEALPWEEMDVRCVYTSPMQRAGQTAEIIAAKGNLSVRAVREFEEMSLGPWDGKPIRQIKEESPEAYAARGRNLFAFKTGPGSESFYDLQYRAVRAMKKILREDSAKDLLIIAHKGVLRALENNLRGKRVDDLWESLDPGAYRILQC